MDTKIDLPPELSPEIAKTIMEVVQGVEQYKNIRLYKPRQLQITLESEGQASLLSRLIDALISFLNRFIKDVQDGTATLSFSLGRVINRAELINTEASAARRGNRKEEFVIDTRINNLCVNYRAITDPQQLMMHIKNNDNMLKAYFRYQNQELPDTIPQLVRIDPTNETAVLTMVDILAKVSPLTKATSFQFNGDAGSMASIQLLGNQRLHALAKNSASDSVDYIAGQEWLLLPASDEPKPMPQKLVYKTFATTIEQSILRQVIATASDIESNFGIVSRNRRANRISELMQYLERLRNNIAMGRYDDASTVRATQLVRLLEAYSSWMVNPYLSMMSLYIRNATAVLNVCAGNN